MRSNRTGVIGVLGVLAFSANASAVNVVIDYTYDTTNFFGAGNPGGAVAGQQARDAIEAAAQYFSDITNDTFSEISTPAQFNGQFGGTVTWQWTLDFTHPATGGNVVLTDQTIAADAYPIYVGSRALSGSTIGQAGPGGWGWSSTPSGGFTQNEIDQLNAITDAFSDAVENRGETSGFANWGGAATFDPAPGNAWHFDHTTEPGAGLNDFFSTAIHELGHALGFGTSSEWSSLVSGGFFTGAASYAANGNSNPQTTGGHLTNGTMSTVYGGTATQEVSMSPSGSAGERTFFTELDAAGLTDIGWDLTPPVISLDGDLNGDGFVGIDDLNIVLGAWNQNVPPADPAADPSGDGFVGIDDLNEVLGNWNAGTPPTGSAVPEPTTLALLGLGGLAVLRRR